MPVCLTMNLKMSPPISIASFGRRGAGVYINDGGSMIELFYRLMSTG